MRNRQVHQVLDQWRKENQTYFSGLPRDILSFLDPYISPDVWIDQRHWNLCWERQMDDDGGTTPYFLSDGTVILDDTPHGMTIIDQQGKDHPNSRKQDFCQLLCPDHQGGFWYEDVKGTYYGTITELHYWGSTTQPPRFLPFPRDYVIIGLVVTNADDMYLHMCEIEGPFYQIVKYNPQGIPGPKYYGYAERYRLSYEADHLYLFDYKTQTQYQLPLLSDQDIRFDPATWPHQRHLNIPADRRPKHFLNSTPDFFFLLDNTFRWLNGTYAIQWLDGTHVVKLIDVPSGREGQKLWLSRAGELFLITSSLTSNNVFQLYRLV